MESSGVNSSIKTMGTAAKEINKTDASVTIVTGSQGAGNIFAIFQASCGTPKTGM